MFGIYKKLTACFWLERKKWKEWLIRNMLGFMDLVATKIELTES